MKSALRGRAFADWLILIGGLTLFVALFLTWSHQLPPALLNSFAGVAALRGVPRNPTGWQVYSVADVLLALLAAALIVLALRGRSRAMRIAVLVAVGVGLAFTAHAEGTAPTNGTLALDPNNSPAYLPRVATPGAGEIAALVGLGLAAVGLMLSFAPDLSSRRVRNAGG